MEVCRLEGLNCPGCAAKIERTLVRKGIVTRASINLADESLHFEVAEGGATEETYAIIQRIVDDIEDGVRVVWRQEKHGEVETAQEESFGTAALYMRLAASCAALAAARFIGMAEWLMIALYLAGYVLAGGDVLLRAIRNIRKGELFDENFLMAAATLGAIGIREYPEAIFVMVFYQLGEYFQERAVSKSRRSIRALMDIRPDTAVVERDGKLVTVSPSEVMVGEVIVVKPGERVSLDCVALSEGSTLDLSALTGESAPKALFVGDDAVSGAVNQSAVLYARVTKPFAESTVSRILELAQNAAARKAPTEQFITRFSRIYTPVVVGLAALLAVIPPLVTGQPFAEWLSRALVFLVVSCPCALVLSVPLSYFAGIGACSRSGILVKGGNYLEALGRLDTLAVDKTGTLTKGKFALAKTLPAKGVLPEQLLGLAAACEMHSTHPIARAIAVAGKGLKMPMLTDMREYAGMGVSAMSLEGEVLVGSARLFAEHGIRVQNEMAGAVHVSLGGEYLGTLIVADEIKPAVRDALLGLRKSRVRRIHMLTGDSDEVAREVASALPIDGYSAQLMPQHKVEILESLIKSAPKGSTVGFAGDGVNDAPVLARADVGIAMGALGSDAAIEAADVVLMTDDLSRLPIGIAIARLTQSIVKQNIVLSLGVKAAVLGLATFGIAGMWLAIFADVGVALLAVLNALRCNAGRIIETNVEKVMYD